MNGDRREVFCLGATLDSPVVRELENGSCVVHLATPDDAPVPVERLRAVLVCFTPADIEPYCAWASMHARTLADYGIRLELVSPDDATLGQVQSRSGPALKLASVRARTAPPAAALAENIAPFRRTAAAHGPEDRRRRRARTDSQGRRIAVSARFSPVPRSDPS